MRVGTISNGERLREAPFLPQTAHSSDAEHYPPGRNSYVPGGSYFFTVVTERRASIFGNDLTRDLLRAAFRDCFERWPRVRVDAMVMLPDHLHAIWTLPPGDSNYSQRWGAIKKHFTQAWLALNGAEEPRSNSLMRRRRRGVWQRGFWKHALRDERDFERHFDYLHFNPIKHGLVDCLRDWPYSTFHKWVKRGVYESNSGNTTTVAFDFSDLADTAGESVERG